MAMAMFGRKNFDLSWTSLVMTVFYSRLFLDLRIREPNYCKSRNGDMAKVSLEKA